MKPSNVLPILTVLTVLLASCGGGMTEYERLSAAADAKAVEVRALAVDGPCTSADQCQFLQLFSPLGNCFSPPRIIYSIASPTAQAASSAAAEQRLLATQAMDSGPPSNTSCTDFINALLPHCVANRCGA